MAQGHIRHLFPGGNTCRGFVGFFQELRGQAARTVILKGGPGVGKSTLIGEAGRHFERQGLDVNYYHCSGDPDSLDGMLAPEKGFLILDGTAPHIVDPCCPGARDGILNLGVCLDEKQLAARAEEIDALQRSIAGCYARAYRYLAAAQAVRSDAAAVYDEALPEREKRLMLREWTGQIPVGPAGGEEHAFLQAVTCRGVVSEMDSLTADRVLCLDAPWGFDARWLLGAIWDAAGQSGVSRAFFHDPVDPDRPDHVAVGSTAFTTAVLLDAPVLSPQFDQRVLRRESHRLSFDRAAWELLLSQAVEALADAKERHDALESVYTAAMHYPRLDEIRLRFLDTLP